MESKKPAARKQKQSRREEAKEQIGRSKRMICRGKKRKVRRLWRGQYVPQTGVSGAQNRGLRSSALFYSRNTSHSLPLHWRVFCHAAARLGWPSTSVLQQTALATERIRHALCSLSHRIPNRCRWGTLPRGMSTTLMGLLVTEPRTCFLQNRG